MTLSKRLCTLVLCLAAFPAVLSVYTIAARAGEVPVSQGEAVIEITSGRFLWERDAERRLPMASTTKIMTAILAIEDCALDDVLSVPDAAVGIEGSSIYLTAGEKISVRDLLYGLLLRSGNDCAVALAIRHSGSVDAFAVAMNEKARAIGARNTHFCNPHGLPQGDHFTTAHDLALIASYALKNDTFSEIVGSSCHDIPDGGCGYVRHLVNKNKMLSAYDGADGVKTGYTKEAGRCLVSSATRGDMRLACVVLNSPAMYERSALLLDDCFSRFSLCEVFEANGYEEELETDSSAGKRCVVGCREAFSYPLTEEERGEVRIQKILPDRVALPVRAGDVVGKMEIYLGKQLIFSQKIVSIFDVDKSYLDFLRDIIRGKRKICGSTNSLPNAASPAAAPATG